MNYQNVYDKLIEICVERKEVKGYKEVHHIVPRSLGGSDESSNLVELTAREHFIAHLLLAKIYPDTGMVHAAFKMACIFRDNGKVKINSRLYEMLRREHAMRVSTDTVARAKKSKALKGKKQSPEHIRARTDARLKNGPWLSEETKKKIGEGNKGKVGSWAGKKLPRESVEKRKVTMRERGGWEWDDERRQRHSLKIKGKKYPPLSDERKQKLSVIKSQKIQCPHCGKEGQNMVMHRWHFDNCKERDRPSL